MIKFSTILLIGSIVVTGVFGIPKMQELVKLSQKEKIVETETTNLKAQLEKIEPELENLKTLYGESLTTNLDLAKTVESLGGSKISSITSLITRDDELFECAEVSTVDDVQFFNDSTEQMLFKLKVNNMEKFIGDLNRTALSIRKFDLNQKKQEAKLWISTISYSEVKQ